MSEYITFNRMEQFTFEEFDAFLDANPIKMAEILSEKLIQRLLITQDKLYLYFSVTKSYKHISPTASILDYLLMVVRKFVVNSYDSLTENQQQLIQKMFHDDVGHKCKRLFSLDFYRDFILDIYYLMTYPTIKFDHNPNQIHYRNGYVDLKSLTFKERDPCIQYVTKFHNHDYASSPHCDDNPFDSDVEDDDMSEEKEDDQFCASEYKRIVSLI